MAQSHGGRQAKHHPGVVNRDEPALAPLLRGVAAREEGAHLVRVRARVGVRVGGKVRVGVGVGVGVGVWVGVWGWG